MKRHVSNTSRPLKINTPTADIHRDARRARDEDVDHHRHDSTIRPTVRKLPHALKSRRLVSAYSESAPNALNVRIPAWPTAPGGRLLHDVQERRDATRLRRT